MTMNKVIQTNNPNPLLSHVVGVRGDLISFPIRYSVSCENCGKPIYSETDFLSYSLNFCTYKCRFRYVYRNLDFLEEKAFLFIAKRLFPNQKDIVYSQKLIFDASKKIIQLNLLTITLEAQGSRTKKEAQIPEPILGSKVGSSPPYIRGEPLSQEPPGSWLKQSIEPDPLLKKAKGGLSKWI